MEGEKIQDKITVELQLFGKGWSAVKEETIWKACEW